MTRRMSRFMLTALLFSSVLAGRAQAHRLNVFAYGEDGEVKVEAYFSGGGAARKCDVFVYAPDGTLRLEAKTDADGKCSFKPEKIEDLRIVVEAGAHRGEYVLKIPALGGTSVPAAVRAGPEQDKLAAVEAKLKALRAKVRELEKAQSGVSAGDVIAGLAFIFGLTSVAMYLLGRRARAGHDA